MARIVVHFEFRLFLVPRFRKTGFVEAAILQFVHSFAQLSSLLHNEVVMLPIFV